MKKIILLIAILIPTICFATGRYLIYPNNPNLILMKETYETNGSNIHAGCFLFKNTENAVIGGKVFEFEQLCLMMNTATNRLTTYKENKSRFLYNNNTFTYGEPYYFNRKIIQFDVQDMFIDIRDGSWSSRD